MFFYSSAGQVGEDVRLGEYLITIGLLPEPAAYSTRQDQNHNRLEACSFLMIFPIIAHLCNVDLGDITSVSP